MSTINNIAAQDASKTYLQSADASRASAAAATATQQKTTTKAHHGHHSHGADSVTLSDSAKSLASARDVVKSTPDVRDQKVAQIKQQVSDGTYSVPSRVLAQKMISQP